MLYDNINALCAEIGTTPTKFTIGYLFDGGEKSSLPELTENEQAIVKVFKELTDTQQGEIIGRAKVMAEQNDKEYLRKESVS